jgi:hypothetical protein
MARAGNMEKAVCRGRFNSPNWIDSRGRNEWPLVMIVGVGTSPHPRIVATPTDVTTGLYPLLGDNILP